MLKGLKPDNKQELYVVRYIIMARKAGYESDRMIEKVNAAIDSGNWMMLSNLVEYDLSPLLHKEDDWFGTLGERSLAYDM